MNAGDMKVYNKTLKVLKRQIEELEKNEVPNEDHLASIISYTLDLAFIAGYDTKELSAEILEFA
jgi:hypothetical protein